MNGNGAVISIITVSYNAVKTIEQTIYSVVNQTYTDIEYIIIDCRFKLYISIFNATPSITNVSPPNSANNKYLILIFCLQFLHFPPKNI